MKYLLIVMISLTASCSMRTFYPTLGGVVGGAAGSMGGPVTAAAAAGVGVMAGEMAKGNDELKQAKQTITALSKGDVEGLIAAGMGEQKAFMDEALDAVYGMIKLCLIGVLLYATVPILYTRFVHKKHTNGNPKKT